MSDKMRWRYGETNPVVMAVDAETVIELGDLVVLSGDDARPANAAAGGGSEAATQIGFQPAFAGVAMQRSRAGDTSPIRVATTGVFEFDCAAATFEVGDLIGPAYDAGEDELLNQAVVAVPATNRALGRCAKRAPSNTTRVMVDIVSTVMRGGVMPPTAE